MLRICCCVVCTINVNTIIVDNIYIMCWIVFNQIFMIKHLIYTYLLCGVCSTLTSYFVVDGW